MTSDPHAFTIPVDDGVHLSPPLPSDTPALVEYLNDKDIYDRTLRIPSPYTAADAERFLRIAAETTERHGHPVLFAVRDSSGQLIGGCGIDGLVPGHRAEIGYWLGKPFWGQGIMTKVVAALCRLAVDEWDLVRIAAYVFPFNSASARVLEKNGFELEAVLRKHRQKDGRFLDSQLYALVR